MFSKYLSDNEIATICSEKQLVHQMLQFEIALACAQGDLGIIPKEAAEVIAESLKNAEIPPQYLAEGTLHNGIPTITLIALAKQHLPDFAKDYIHFGATSQDVLDTAQVLMIKNAITVFEKRIHVLIQNLSILIKKHAQTPMIGRTRTQQAVPIPFGLKVANWVKPFIRHLERLEQMKPRLLVVQFGGAVGTLSSFTPVTASGARVVITRDEANWGTISKKLADYLNLNDSNPWHTQRDNFAEWANWLAMVTGSLGKMAQDILIMSQTEINEIVENTEGGGKSSTMPHKNNPVLSEAIVVLARQNAQLAALQLQSMIHANERDGTAWALEWQNLPAMMTHCGTALNHALKISTHLKVNEKQMLHNFNSLNGLVYSEAASFILAQYLPRNEAKLIVEKACEAVNTSVTASGARQEGIHLADALNDLTIDLKINWHDALQADKQMGISSEIIVDILKEISEIKPS